MGEDEREEQHKSRTPPSVSQTPPGARKGMQLPASQVSEDVFFEMLRKKEKTHKTEVVVETAQIYSRMQIFSPEPLEIADVKYYKFPFASDIKNDGSGTFTRLYVEWIRAAQGAYLNFKRHGHAFYLKFEKSLICFGGSAKISRNLKSVLDRNEVAYIENDAWLLVENTEMRLVFDLVMNAPVNVNTEIPFLISKHEFDNSILYRAKVNKRPTLKYRDVTNYHYEIDCYFVGEDYAHLFKYNVSLVDIM